MTTMARTTTFLALILSLSINAQTFDSVGEGLPSGEDTLAGGFVGDYDDYFIDSVSGVDPGDCSDGTIAAPWKTLAKAQACISAAGSDVYLKTNSTFTGELLFVEWGDFSATNTAVVDTYCVRDDGSAARWASGAEGCGTEVDADVYYQPFIIVSTTGDDATGDGSLASPYRNPEYAMEQASPGDTVYVRSGTYTNHDGDNGVVYLTSVNGTTNNYIKLKNYPGETVVLDGENTVSNNSGNRASVYLIGVGWIWVEGMKITGGRSNGVEISWSVSDYSHDIVIKNNEIYENGRVSLTDCTDGDGYSGMWSNHRSDNILVDSNYIHDNGRDANTACDAPGEGQHNYRHDHGFYAQGRNITITNNVFANHKAGWHIKTDGYTHTDKQGVVTYPEVPDGSFSHIIRHNTFGPNINPNLTSSDPAGAALRPFNNCPPAYTQTSCGYVADPYNAGTLTWPSKWDFSNNLILDTATISTWTSEAAVYTGDADTETFPGFSNNPGQRCYNNVLQSPTYGTITTVCNTQYTTNATYVDEQNSKINQTLSSFNMVDPANYDYHIQTGSSAENYGSSLTAEIFDKDGNVRSDPPDVGAYEVQ